MTDSTELYTPSPEFVAAMERFALMFPNSVNAVKNEFMTLQLEISRLNQYIASLEIQQELIENGVGLVPTGVITQTFKGEQNGE
jgi:hypothetical protein